MKPNHFADRLLNQIEQKGSPVCVGIDPVLEQLPPDIWPERPAADDQIDIREAVQAICRFVTGVFQAVAPHVACVKLQSACFERYLWPGVEAYHRLIDEAEDFGLTVIGDAKRGDIGVSASHYAAGCLGDLKLSGAGKLVGPDALTINTYFGSDGIQPFIDVAKSENKGLFALVRTSNPGGDAIQSLELAGGGRVADAVAKLVAGFGAQDGCVGRRGYSLLGAVVGATKAEDAARLRALMPQQLFLVPGFGAQGAGADDIRPCFKPDGTGAIITASRSIIYAYRKTDTADWLAAIEQATVEMKTQVNAAIG